MRPAECPSHVKQDFPRIWFLFLSLFSEMKLIRFWCQSSNRQKSPEVQSLVQESSTTNHIRASHMESGFIRVLYCAHIHTLTLFQSLCTVFTAYVWGWCRAWRIINNNSIINTTSHSYPVVFEPSSLLQTSSTTGSKLCRSWKCLNCLKLACMATPLHHEVRH